VLVDADQDDCRALKRTLEDAASAVGLPTRSAVGAAGGFVVLNRIAIEELEAWFLGDVEAVATAYPGVPLSLGQRQRFRDPDAVPDVATSGFIANTDFGWFSPFMHRVEPSEEVDFWQPSPHGFKAASRRCALR
jgi:hypothetical protein